MAGEERTAVGALTNELLRHPRQFSFYQTVRLLERSTPRSAVLGYDGPAERESIRLRPNPSMGFASADLHDVERLDWPGSTPGESRTIYRVTVNFLGLYGAGSPLPAFYTEDIVMHDEMADTRRDFFDLFHHRYLSFLYRTWEKYRYFLRYRAGATDRFSQWMRGLISLHGRAGVGSGDEAAVEHPERLLSSIGLLLLHSRSAATLAKILAHYFDGLPIRVEQFMPREVVIEDAQRALLGRANCTLGVDCSPGRTVPDISGKFRICVGPLDFAAFRGLLPDAADFRKLRKVVPYLLRNQLDYDIALTLRGEEIPPLDLTPNCPARLGWSSWLGSHPGNDSTVVLET
jgi:type VI secretion system protein ImpH